MSQYRPTKISFLDLVWRYKFLLAFYIVVTSAASFAVLYILNIVPQELRVLDDHPQDQATVLAATTTVSVRTDRIRPEPAETGGELPVRVIIKKIGVDTAVTNPASTDNVVLNDYLLRGAVRYPGSGTLGKGNVFIFGHSTGLRVVNNQAFKAFNNLKDLNIGDEIRVHSKHKEYVYKVVSVSLVDSDTKLVDFAVSKNMLTLSTCNVFGEKQERFVVEAHFVTSYDRS